MQFLAVNGYKSINLYELLQALEGRRSADLKKADKLVAITFDDGWADNYSNAYPILQSLGLMATFFVVTSQIEDKQYMSWAQLREMQGGGMRIESHTHSHTPLERLSNLEAQWELMHSKRVLQEYLGKPVSFISFPHGSYSGRVLEEARRSEYAACCTSRFGDVTVGADAYELPRIMIKKSHDIEYFRGVCEGRVLTRLKGRLVDSGKSVVRNAVGLGTYNRLFELRHRLTRSSTKPREVDR